MEEQDLLGFAAGFEAVSAWRGAMLARGYTMPLQLCHGLSQAMKHLNLTFPQAFRQQLLLWQPTDKTDQYLRRFLLDFGHRVLAAGRAQPR